MVKLKTKRAVYAISFWPGKCWWHVWRPVWHGGRGPYVSIGLYFFAVYRGY